MVGLIMIVLSLLLGSVLPLRLEDGDEGTCQGIPSKPVLIRNLNFMDRLTYIPAGSRFNHYFLASGHPRFGEMSESELVNNFCLSHNVPLSQPVAQGSTFGFAGVINGNFTARQRLEEPGVWVATAHNDLKGHGPEPLKIQTITLTDYKTFAFVSLCWTIDYHHQYKGWQVYTSSPQLSRSIRRKIENHAASLGFDRQNFLFLNYNGCRADQGISGGSSSGVEKGYY